MRWFEVTKYAKKLKAKHPAYKLTAEIIVGRGGSLVVQVRSESKNGFAYIDTGLTQEEFGDEAAKLVEDMNLALKHPEYYEYAVLTPDNETIVVKSQYGGKYVRLERPDENSPWEAKACSDNEDVLHNHPENVNEKLFMVLPMQFLREVN